MMNTLPEVNFVERGAAPRHLAQHAAADQPDLGLAGRAARDADVDHLDLARVRLARVDPQPGLGAVERRGGDRARPPRPRPRRSRR